MNRIQRILAITLMLSSTVGSNAAPNGTVREGVDAQVPAGYVRLIQIEDSQGVVRATSLIAVDWYDDRRIQRLLIRTPTGEHLVLTESEFPLEGTKRFHLLVEETGWAAELEERSGLKFDHVLELADPGAVAARFVEAEQPRSVVVKAPGLRGPFEHSSTTWDDRFLDDLFVVMAAQGETARLVEAMDPPSRQAIRFLGSLARCGECSFSLGEVRPLVETLARAIEEEASEAEVGPPAGQVWRGTPEFTAREGKELGPEPERFVEEFRSIPKSDLLAGLRPDGTAPPPE